MEQRRPGGKKRLLVNGMTWTTAVGFMIIEICFIFCHTLVFLIPLKAFGNFNLLYFIMWFF